MLPTFFPNDTTQMMGVKLNHAFANLPIPSGSGPAGPTGPAGTNADGWVNIGSVTLGSNQATITFSGISGSYRHLKVVGTARASGATDVQEVLIAINSDTTAANYETSIGFGGSGSGGNVLSPQLVGSVSGSAAPSGACGSFEFMLAHYANTTFNKAWTGRTWVRRNASQYIIDFAGQRINTAAVTRVDLTLNTGDDFTTGSRFDCYVSN